jgi:outer membrane receptor protein involved in Fe transport
MGAELRVYREHNYNFANMTPQLNFASAFTGGPLDNAPPAPIGQGLASYLLGIPSGGQINVNDSSAEQSRTTGLYIQDDWRASSKLTITLGLRWDYDSPITERFNRSVRGFDFAATNPAPHPLAGRPQQLRTPHRLCLQPHIQNCCSRRLRLCLCPPRR